MKQLIDEQIKTRWNKLAGLKEEIEIEEQLEQEIESYGFMQETIEKEQEQIQKALDKIKKMEKENKKRFKDIEKYMKRFNVDEKKVSKWVAKLEETLKYKTVRPDYKDLWSETMKKVNAATQKVMNELKEAQLDVKRTKTQIRLNIQQEGVGDIIKKLFKKLKDLFSAFSLFNKITKRLPKI